MNLIYGTIAVALLSFAAGWQANGLRLNAEIDQLHATWNQAYANQTQAIIEKERDLTTLNNKLETEHATATQAIGALYDDNRRLASRIGMRDPTPTRRSTLPATNATSQCTSATTESRLSDEATQFLLELARDADNAAQYANLCHQWAVGSTEVINTKDAQ
jgi:hypothetical protein